MTATLAGLVLLLTFPMWGVGCDKVKEVASRVTGGEEGKRKAGPKKEAANEEQKKESKVPRKIAMVVSFEGYQDKELKIPRDKFEAAGFRVDVISFFGGRAKGALGGSVQVDRLLEDTLELIPEYAAVVFVGGPGSIFYHNEKKAHEFLQDAVKHDKVIGAICLAPYTLGYAGVLKGVKATAWTGGKYTRETLSKTGAFFREGPVVTDGKFVTANGPDAAVKFAEAVLRLLK